MTGSPRLVGLDTMNYWIEGDAGGIARKFLRHTDVLMINDAETRMLSNEHNLLRAARHIFKLGPSTLIIKRGEHGATDGAQERRLLACQRFPSKRCTIRPARATASRGGFMGYLASAPRVTDAVLRRAMVYGSVMGSFAVERFGLERLRHVKRHEINARARHFAKLTQFRL